MARSPMGRTGWAALVAAVTLPMLVIGALSALTAVPLDLETLSKARPPLHDLSRRRPRLAGACGLNEVQAGQGCQRATAATVDQEEVTFPSSIGQKGINPLQGTLSLPRGLSGRRPGVILMGGSGPTNRHSTSSGDLLLKLPAPFPLFDRLAEGLARQGLVVLRYDKRSCAACYRKLYDVEQFSMADFVTDARDAVNWLAARPEVDPEAIVIIGHSEGAQLAPLVARGDPRVKAVVLLAGTTEPMGAVITAQLERLAALRAGRGDRVGAWAHRSLAAQMKACFDKLDGPNYDPKEECLAPALPQRVLKEYDALNATIPKALGALPCPVLAVQGSLDINVHPGQIERYRELLTGNDAELHRLPGVSHPLVNALATPEPADIDPQVWAILTAFLTSVGRRSP